MTRPLQMPSGDIELRNARQRPLVVWESGPRWFFGVAVAQLIFGVGSLIGAGGWDIVQAVVQAVFGLGIAIIQWQGRVLVSADVVVVRPLWRSAVWPSTDVERGLVPDGEFQNLRLVQKAIRRLASGSGAS